MPVENFEQLSPEWFERRRGCITASSCEKLFGTKAARQKYICELAAQRLTQEATDNFRGTYWTDRGLALEEEARAAVEFHLDCEIQKVGLISSEWSRWVVCSPDGLIGEDTILQIKCPAPQTHVMYGWMPGLAEDYYYQLYAECAITGRRKAVIVSYCPGIKPIFDNVLFEFDKMDSFRTATIEALNDIDDIVKKLSSYP